MANIEEVQLCISKILDLYAMALSGIKTADEKAHKEYRRQLTVQERDFEREIANLEFELSKATAISEASANQIEIIEKQHALEVEKLNDRLDGLRNKRQ